MSLLVPLDVSPLQGRAHLFGEQGVCDLRLLLMLVAKTQGQLRAHPPPCWGRCLGAAGGDGAGRASGAAAESRPAGPWTKGMGLGKEPLTSGQCPLVLRQPARLS